MTKILVIEDSSNERNGLCRLLEGAGYEVCSAADGIEALQKIRDDKFDLLLVDIWMPRMSGLELLAHLPEDTRPKALVITGDESPDTLLRSLREKAYLFIANLPHEMSDRVTGRSLLDWFLPSRPSRYFLRQ